MKRIYLKDLLEYIEPVCSLVIWTSDNEDTPVFEGAAMDVPFYLTKMHLEDPRKNDLDGVIDARLHEKRAIMVISVAED